MCDVSDPPFRPQISDPGLDTEYRRTNLEYLIERCWAEDVNQRPAMKSILRTLNKINPYKYIHYNNNNQSTAGAEFTAFKWVLIW